MNKISFKKKGGVGYNCLLIFFPHRSFWEDVHLPAGNQQGSCEVKYV